MHTDAAVARTPSLARLHWRLTLLYVSISAVAVAGMAALVARSDAHLRETELQARMETRAQAAAALVSFDQGRPELGDLSRDAVATGSPQVAVLLGIPPRRQVFATSEPPLPVATEQLLGVAGRAAREEDFAWGKAEGADGLVPVVAVPVYNDLGKLAGAVVAVGDPTAGAAEHTRLLLALALGCVGLLLVAGVGAHLLAARSIRHAIASSERQSSP